MEITECPMPSGHGFSFRRDLFLFLLRLLLPLPALAQGTLTTTDGLRLSLSDSGSVSSLQVNGIELTSPRLASGFLLREVPAEAANIIPNGSFERGTARPDSWSWKDTEAGTWTWDSENARDGARTMKLTMAGTAPRRGPMLASNPFPIRPNTPYTFSWAVRTQDLTRGLDVYVIEEGESGRPLQRGKMTGAGTTGWSVSSISFTSAPTATRAYLKVEQYRGSGTAWVGDFKAVDLFSGRAPAALAGKVSEDAGALAQTSVMDGLRLEARFQSVGAAIRVDASLSDTTGRDRAVELSFRLPVALAGWRFDQSFVASTPILPAMRYENVDAGFGLQSHSRYPFVAVRSEAAGLALAVPMGPQMQRFGCDEGSGLFSSWDLGLSPAAAKTRSTAKLSFWIYSVDPRWGLRAAADKYYALDPDSFSSPVKAAGAWIIWSEDRKMREIPDFLDFGWGFNEAPTDLAFNNANRILALRYVDACGWFRRFPERKIRPPYEDVVLALEQDAAGGSGSVNGVPVKEMAQAIVNSAPFDEHGRHQVEADGYFWYGNRLQIYPASPDPDIPAPSLWSVLTRYWVDAPQEAALRKGNRYDGLFLDDLSDTFARVENHRRPLWAYSDVPLTFSYKTGKVVLYNGFSMAEFCAALRKREHAKDLILFGSSNPGIYVWLARDLDVVGGEVPGAETVDRAYLRRALSYGKPWSNLLVPHSGSGAATGAEVEAYLRQALLLGYFPGFNGRYWGDPKAYERDRPLFRRYIPLIRKAVEAGWRPVNYTSSSDPAIYVERFDGGKAVFYLAAQNSGTEKRSIQLKLDGSGLGIGATGAVAVRELVRGTDVAVTRSGTDALLADSLGPGETVLYEVSVTDRIDRKAAPSR